MCIIIHNKYNKLTKSVIYESFRANSDGAGLMYVENNKIRTFKTLSDIDKFYEVYTDLRHNNNIKDIILHFRIGTSGSLDINNVHPFKINKGLYFVHNGILKIDVPINSNISDTIIFNNEVLKKLPSNFLSNKAILFLISEYCAGNKLLFLDNKNNITIINEHLGHTDKCSNWYSNYSYCNYYGFSYSKNKKSKKRKNKDVKITYHNTDKNDIAESIFDTCACCGSYLLSATEFSNLVCDDCRLDNNLNENEIDDIKRALLNY